MQARRGCDTGFEGEQSGQTQTGAKQLHCMVESVGTNHTHYDALITFPTSCDISLRSPVPHSRALFLRHRRYTEAHNSLIQEMPPQVLPIGERLTKLKRVMRGAARRARNAMVREHRTINGQETHFNLLNWVAPAVATDNVTCVWILVWTSTTAADMIIVLKDKDPDSFLARLSKAKNDAHLYRTRAYSWKPKKNSNVCAGQCCTESGTVMERWAKLVLQNFSHENGQNSVEYEPTDEDVGSELANRWVKFDRS